jgi:hypothetical protein
VNRADEYYNKLKRRANYGVSGLRNADGNAEPAASSGPAAGKMPMVLHIANHWSRCSAGL